MKYSAVIFDFDYTLADTEEAIVTCFRAVLGAHGAEADADAIKRTIGWTLEQAFETLLGETDPVRLAALRKEYVAVADEHMVDMTRFYDGALALLRALRTAGVKVGVVSTKYRYRIFASFLRYGAENLVDLIVGSEDVTRFKPEPDGLLLWAERMGIASEETLYVGDHTVDARASQAAGMAFAGVAQGMTARTELEAFPHIAVVDSISELGRVLGIAVGM